MNNHRYRSPSDQVPAPGASPWTASGTPGTPHIADQYLDLLSYLAPAQRTGMIARLTAGYYENWRPSRYELADIIAVELGILSFDQAAHRRRQRLTGQEPASITPALRARYRQRTYPTRPNPVVRRTPAPHRIS